MRRPRPRRARVATLLAALLCAALLALVPRAAQGPDAERPTASSTGGVSEGPGEDGRAAQGGAGPAGDEPGPEGVPGTSVSVAVRPMAPEGAAAELLEGYLAEGGCALVRSDWLDLFGSTWSCLVQGDGWVDLCVVRAIGDAGEQSEVRVMRMETGAWEDLSALG